MYSHLQIVTYRRGERRGGLASSPYVVHPSKSPVLALLARYLHGRKDDDTSTNTTRKKSQHLLRKGEKKWCDLPRAQPRRERTATRAVSRQSPSRSASLSSRSALSVHATGMEAAIGARRGARQPGVHAPGRPARPLLSELRGSARTVRHRRHLLDHLLDGGDVPVFGRLCERARRDGAGGDWEGRSRSQKWPARMDTVDRGSPPDPAE